MMHTVAKQSNVRVLLAAAVVCWVGTFAGGAAVSAGAQKTANDGVYTAAQADRGEAIFKDQCASCHAPVDFTNDDFLKKWTGKPLHELFDTVSGTMPMDNPGTLKPQQYADVIAYVLALNKFPAGQEELKSGADVLKAISFTKKSH